MRREDLCDPRAASSCSHLCSQTRPTATDEGIRVRMSPTLTPMADRHLAAIPLLPPPLPQVLALAVQMGHLASQPAD